MPGFDDEYEEYDDEPSPANSGARNIDEGDVLAQATGGAVRTKDVARKGVTKAADHFGGPLLEGGAIAAFAFLDGDDAQAEREALARRLGTTPEFIEANSAALKELAETEDHQNKIVTALIDWMPSAIGAAFGFLVPIPFASIVFGYVGEQVSCAINPENPHEINVRDIAKEVERKQLADERVTRQEAFFLALSPQDRKLVYEQMNAQLSGDLDPAVVKMRMSGIIVDNSHLIRAKVESLGLVVEDGEDAAAVLANAMSKPDPKTKVKLHPILVLLDNADPEQSLEQNCGVGRECEPQARNETGRDNYSDEMREMRYPVSDGPVIDTTPIIPRKLRAPARERD